MTISDSLAQSGEEELQRILEELTPEELRWVDVRLKCRGDAEASRMAGWDEGLVYQWVAIDRMREAARLSQQARFLLHQARLDALTGKAIERLEKEMDNSSVKSRGSARPWRCWTAPRASRQNRAR